MPNPPIPSLRRVSESLRPTFGRTLSQSKDSKFSLFRRRHPRKKSQKYAFRSPFPLFLSLPFAALFPAPPLFVLPPRPFPRRSPLLYRSRLRPRALISFAIPIPFAVPAVDRTHLPPRPCGLHSPPRRSHSLRHSRPPLCPRPHLPFSPFVRRSGQAGCKPDRRKRALFDSRKRSLHAPGEIKEYEFARFLF